MVIVVMGVSGSGKTTIGRLLAESLQWQFSDADDFHSATNIEKMQQGIPLTDADRFPWLQAIRVAIEAWLSQEVNVVLACSALKSEYRQWLQPSEPLQMSQQQSCVRWVYLQGSFELIWQRLSQRQGHYMKANLLQSQMEALEEPEDALRIDVFQSPEAIVQQIRSSLVL
ncbi:MAG: gluconokinase [Oscillatoriophycideae cyanobacterium NC_groundwater_1537_Pr4_S-0.65um_50_18]|nr:gluconokinase [Oscillatoriophycideae cyanobacterium NC_groundwater_1537_Pr4_S-0.65um_50_18]